eukprot:gene3782-13850_t
MISLRSRAFGIGSSSGCRAQIRKSGLRHRSENEARVMICAGLKDLDKDLAKVNPRQTIEALKGGDGKQQQ